MSAMIERGEGSMKYEGFILNVVCVALAGLFLGLLVYNFFSAGSFISIDSLFFSSFCLLMVIIFLISPALALRSKFSRSASDKPEEAAAAWGAISLESAATTRTIAPAPRKKVKRAMPPDVDQMVATMQKINKGAS
jgi:hypothetical protein